MTEIIIKRKGSRKAVPPIAFTCGGCGVTLRMRRDALTTSGPCPVCGTVIECCPAEETEPSTRTVVNSAEMAVPVVSRGSFQARQKIQRPAVLDDSWKKRCEKDMRRFRMRKRFERSVHSLFDSSFARVAWKVGVGAVILVLVATVAFVVYDRFNVGR